jgi:glycosyltransferase involved in cell wall biosynthesis
MRISIITVCYNSVNTIADALKSIQMQTYDKVEHIIIDGASCDGTLDIIKSFGANISKLVSEADGGIYNAMNKGFSYATGDVIGYLNSDDYYFDKNILAEVVRAFELNQCDYVYGDVEMIDKSGRLVRHWITGKISPGNMHGKQIPHPVFFIKKEFLEKLLVVFDDSYRIAADLKQQLIIINKLKASGYYIQKPLVVMRLGGESTRSLFSYINGWIESRRAYNDVFGSGGTCFTLRKVLTKLKTIRSTHIFDW